MNKIMLIGNLTRDPEAGTTQSGISYCRIGIAVTRKFANADGERKTDFFNITAWRGLADNCVKFLTKGKKICVVGELQTNQYDDKDGNKRTAYDISADDIEFLTPRGESGEGGSTPSYKQNNTGAPAAKGKLEPIEDDDLPF
jgi:single-strand DNA-binding protein